MGAALLDLEDPRRLLARLPYWILGPHEPYETSGEVPNVVFSNGHILDGDKLHIYYGAADSSVCLATGRLSVIVEELRQHRV